MSDAQTPDSARRRATRARLVEAAHVEFGRLGIDATSVERICEVAGFTRGAFYSNFTSKDDLCVAVAQDVVDRTLQASNDAIKTLQPDTSPAEIIASILGAASLSEDQHRTQLELQLRGWRDPDLGARLAAVRASTQPVAVQVITTAAQRLGLRFVVPTADFIRIVEALFFAPSLAQEGTAERLMTLVSSHLTEQVER